jgi:AcrR family transcriptional regulator
VHVADRLKLPAPAQTAARRRVPTQERDVELQDERDKHPRGRDAVVEALIDSATKLFAERGTEGASVREIAAGAGVNHALVFRHFGSKERLVRVVLDRLLDELVEEFRSAGVDPASLAAVGEGVAGRERLWKLLTRAVLDGEIDVFTERSFPEIEFVLDAIRRGIESGAVPDVDPRTLLMIVLSGALGWSLLDPLMAEVVGMPGETPQRRRELARAAFAELIGVLPPRSAALTEAEARAARVPERPPFEAAATTRPERTRPDGDGPPRGREQVCDALVDAAMELMALRGPAAVSIRQIAARAQVNHALVFRHFGSKEGLVQAVWERAVEDFAGHAMAVPDYQSLMALTEALAESETTWRLLARAILDGETDTLAATPYRFINQMVWAIARGQAAGMVETPIHPRMIVAMVIAMGFGWLVFHPVLIPLLGMPQRDLVEHRNDLREVTSRLLGWNDPPSLRSHAH